MSRSMRKLVVALWLRFEMQCAMKVSAPHEEWVNRWSKNRHKTLQWLKIFQYGFEQNKLYIIANMMLWRTQFRQKTT